MRRFMASMLAALGCLSTPLAAQLGGGGDTARTSWGMGLAATLGGGWQIEGGEIGLQRRVGAGPIQFLTAAARFGSFIDEGAIIGGARGFIAAAVVGLRTGSATLAEIGTDENPTAIRVDLTVEAAGYLGSNSPLPQGGSWAAVSLLPGLAFGAGGGVRYHLLLGPTAFLGGKTSIHSFLGIRFEAPLARRERRP